MLILDEIRNVLLDLVKVLPELNRSNRKELRDVVLELEAELERSLTVAILYLDGVPKIKPKQELLDHLRNAPAKLMESYSQFKICAGLYGLADRFGEVFSSIKGSVAVGQISSVDTMIKSLASGERMVIDGLRNMTQMMSDAALELDQLEGMEFENGREQLLKRVGLERNELRSQIVWLNKTVKDVLGTF